MFRAALFACLVALLPASAFADFLEPAGPAVLGEYIVWAGKGQGDEKLRSIAAYAVLGLEVWESLRFVESGLPPAQVVRMPDGLARFLARTGFDVMPQSEVSVAGTFRRNSAAMSVDVVSPWHLDRIDQRRLPLDGQYRHAYTGKSAGVIVIDTSVLRNPDFADRLLPDGADFVRDGLGLYTDCGQGDTHATGVISVLAGNRYGVAKEMPVVPVRVFRCDGTAKASVILAALDWVIGYVKRHPERPWLVNMSFSARGASRSYDPFFKKLSEHGVLLVAAAGNSGNDASEYTPASSRYVLAAGGTNVADRRFSGSNYGRVVVIYAPAESVATAGGYGDAEWTGTGTSLAAPQVVGHLAQLWEQFPNASAVEIKSMLLANATPDIVLGTRGAPGKLLFNGKFAEAFSTFAARFAPGERRLTVELKVMVPGGGVSPATQVSLYRGPAKAGACQGRSFATVALQGGAGTVTLRGWSKAPATVCARTSFGTVGQVAVEVR